LILKRDIENAAETRAPGLLDFVLQKVIANLPFQQEVLPGIGLDYSFRAKPVVTQHDIALPIAGEFYPYNKQPGSPGEPEKLPDSPTTNEMIEIYLSEWSLNSLLRAAFLGGKMAATVTAENAPPVVQCYFVSDYYARIAPGIIDMFGNESAMAFALSLESQPNATISDDGFDIANVFRVTLLGRKKDDPEYSKAIVVDCNNHATGFISTKGEYITGSITVAQQFYFTLVENFVGQIDLPAYICLLTDLIEVFNDEINKALAEGIPLPSFLGLSFKKPVIVWSASHYVLLSGDFQ